MSIRTLIVDDEPLARRGLALRLARHPDIEIVGEAGSGREAFFAISEHRPALMFLDVQMPGVDGLELLRAVPVPQLPLTIFVTAYDHYALQAFETNALDYLLKPIDPRRLASALDRVRSAAAVPAVRGGSSLEQLFVRDGSRCWFVPLREVQLLTSEGNCVRLSWGKIKPLLARSLTAIEQRLDPAQFFRANRGQIINLKFIESIEAGVNGRLHAQLRDGPEIEISRRQARLFKALTSI